MKIKAINYQTSSYQEKILMPEMGVLNKYLVGRHPNCDLVLNAPEVSRVHGMICYYQEHYYFIDLASSDGSRINNQQVEVNQSYLLKPDDTIRIGDFLLLIEEMESVGNQPKPQVTAWQSGELMVRCVRVIEETPDVKTFSFVAEPPVQFSYQPGQFVTLELQINRKPVKRSYSISSTPSRPHNLEITVKRVPPPSDALDAPPGLVSNWLHDNLKVGSQVKISEPLGDFTCANSRSPKLLFISAGSGITPMMSMSRWLLDTSADSDVVFFHSSRTTNDIIFRQELELMASRYPNFKLAVTLTCQDANSNPLARIGRLNKSMLQAIAPDFADRTVYVCGPNAFMQGVQAILKELEFPMQNYYEESFGLPKNKKKLLAPTEKTQAVRVADLIVVTDNPKYNGQAIATPEEIVAASQVSSPTPTSTAEVLVFAKSGLEVVYDSADTILETAQKEGIELPHMCKMGVCRRCKLRLLEGEVRYDKQPECQSGYILTCIAQPVGRVAIEA
ncbi:MAG: FHA domain-containing protein [Heteroscytonema crispum UTEX LB 1556]